MELVSSLLVMSLFWSCLCNHLFVVSGHCLDDQKSLLLQFKNNLTFRDPADSENLISWNERGDCCSWIEVTCDREGHVIGLNLLEFDEIFFGPIPHAVGNMKHLSELDLSNCGFNGTLPNSLSNLTELTYLDLSYNHFRGLITSFVLSKKLVSLLLSHNDLRGIIPSTHFEGLHNLTNVDLSYNHFTGKIPSSLFTLPLLEKIQLSHNQFSKVDEFINVSSPSLLDTFDLSFNNLSGPFLTYIYQFTALSTLQLSSNKFTGAVQLNKFFELKNLYELDFSYNNLSVKENLTAVDSSSFHIIYHLNLAHCNLKAFPVIIRKLWLLLSLDLSDNQIQGIVPNWIWELKDLSTLDLSHNLFNDLEGPLQNLNTLSLLFLDLHFNKFHGPLPFFSRIFSVEYLDFSSNKFSSLIPEDMGKNMGLLAFLSLSNNSLNGRIPQSLCDALNLELLDLSINNISGTIPSCFMRRKRLTILNLKNNNLSGHVPHTSSGSCQLSSLNLHGNLLDGPIPISLAYCWKLEVLDLGSNQIIDGFPCFLKEISSLRILILRNNKFQGPLTCSKGNKTWEMLQIVDIAFNNFNGKLPGKFLSSWKRYIMHNEQEAESKSTVIRERFELFEGLYYQDSVMIMSKNQELELVKILTIFTCIDFSSNHFEGPIPEELMDFKELRILNLSNNAFSGEIKPSIGNLMQLESLDLSKNSMNGKIPMELATLSFLSYLNLSFNHLVGKIPTGTQLQTFSASSFEGNDGLYGPPLTENPNDKERKVLPQPKCGRLACTIDWNVISFELGLVFGHGVIFCPLLISKSWRVWYWRLVHKILCWIFPQMHLQYITERGQTYATLRWSY